jgi:hypothetical protein
METIVMAGAGELGKVTTVLVKNAVLEKKGFEEIHGIVQIQCVDEFYSRVIRASDC